MSEAQKAQDAKARAQENSAGEAVSGQPAGSSPLAAGDVATGPGHVVIVGAGLAGYSLARGLRSLGHADPITLIDSEPATYDRPPLSKRLFDEDFDLACLAFATAADLAEQGIDARFGVPVAALDAVARTVELSDGTVVHGDTIVIATGGRARTLPIPGGDLPGVGVLRSYADAMELRRAVTQGTRVAVVGAGLIGAELASSLLEAGAVVTLIDPVAVPLVPAVGELLATHLHAMHTERGIRVITGLTESFTTVDDGIRVDIKVGESGTATAAQSGAAAGAGTGTGAETGTAASESAIVDRVVVGVGLVPNTDLAQAAGLECDNGIVVDERFATSAAGIYAIGDVARKRGADATLQRREEHWEAAQRSGQEAAYALMGQPVPARGAAWFWSDRHGHHLEAVGTMSGPGQVLVRDGVGTGTGNPVVFLTDGGHLLGAAAIDEPKTIRAARALIDGALPVTAEELLDPATNLRKLVKAKRAQA